MFLGNATKNSVALRTAPFKNLFRQWFRIINGTLESKELLKKEQELFGSATDIREKSCPPIGVSKVRFFINPNVDTQQMILKKIIPQKIIKGQWQKMLFGERNYQNPTTPHSYIKEGTQFKLKISFPKEYEDIIKKILKAINEYGTIGLKSRKAFGSIQIVDSINLNDTDINIPNSQNFDRTKEYPHCIYKKWKTKNSYDSWNKTLEVLLEIYGKYIEDKYKSISKLAKENDRKRAPTQTRLIIKKVSDKYVGKILHIKYNYSFIQDNNNLWSDIYNNISKEMEEF